MNSFMSGLFFRRVNKVWGKSKHFFGFLGNTQEFMATNGVMRARVGRWEWEGDCLCRLLVRRGYLTVLPYRAVTRCEI